MKRKILTLMMCLLASGAFGDEYRTFTDTIGRTIKAKVVEFDSSRGKLLIEREGGAQAWVAPDSFAEGDQAYIRSWIRAVAMLSDQSLRISAEPVSVSFDNGVNPHGKFYTSGKITDRSAKVHHKAHYAVEFRNIGDVEVQALSLECHCYVKMVARGSWDDKIWMTSENLTVGPIKAGERVELSTGEIALKEWLVKQIEYVKNSGNISNDMISMVTTHDERLEGLWIRITVPLSDGEPLVRDVCFPDDLMDKVAWEEKTGDPFAKPQDAPAVPITSLADIRKRGRPKDRVEFNYWMVQAEKELHAAGTDKILLQQVSDGMDIFYVAKFDKRGTGAWVRGLEFEKAEAYGLALHWYETAVQTEEIYHLVRFTEKLASSAHEGLRNGELAVKYATIALDKDKKSDKLLELLARAYARNGQFDLAVKTQKEAIKRLEKTRKDEKDLAEYRKRLELYQDNKPYTEPGKKK